jgi:hypothetical protein
VVGIVISSVIRVTAPSSKVSPDGTVATVAGGGHSHWSYTGDSGSEHTSEQKQTRSGGNPFRNATLFRAELPLSPPFPPAFFS